MTALVLQRVQVGTRWLVSPFSLPTLGWTGQPHSAAAIDFGSAAAAVAVPILALQAMPAGRSVGTMPKARSLGDTHVPRRHTLVMRHYISGVQHVDQTLSFRRVVFHHLHVRAISPVGTLESCDQLVPLCLPSLTRTETLPTCCRRSGSVSRQLIPPCE